MNKYKFEKINTTIETYEVWAESESEAMDMVYENNDKVEFAGRQELPVETNFVGILPISEDEDEDDEFPIDVLGDDDISVGGRHADLSIK